MKNDQIEAAWDYHNRTKHSYQSVRRSAHFLDWPNQPLPFKIYSDLQPIPLPQETGETGMPALEAIVISSVPARPVTPALRELAHLLHYSAGITKRRRYSGGEILFRAAACTGALYEIELYLVCGPLGDLAPGVYHYSPRDSALRRLREGDYRSVTRVDAPAVVIASGTYWRNAWKYQARTYRHFGWDNGTLHANVLAMAAALGFPARLMCGFVDRDINHLLGLDTRREVALTMTALGHSAFPAPPAPAEIPQLQLATVPLSNQEVDYPLMRRMHEASSLESQQEVSAWRTDASAPAAERPRENLSGDTIEQVILRRGSSRRFLHEPITSEQLFTILECATAGIPADFLGAQMPSLNHLYLIVHAVEGLEPGAYFYKATERRLDSLKQGRFRREAAYLALEQNLAGDAAAAIFLLADLHQVLRRFGNRGYRAVQLEAGIRGGKIYLGAYAQRLGATGLTFYDDEVVEFFSPHAAGKSAIFLVAVGHGALARGT